MDNFLAIMTDYADGGENYERLASAVLGYSGRNHLDFATCLFNNDHLPHILGRTPQIFARYGAGITAHRQRHKRGAGGEKEWTCLNFRHC